MPSSPSCKLTRGGRARLIELAMGFAAQQGRRVLSPSDVEAAFNLSGECEWSTRQSGIHSTSAGIT